MKTYDASWARNVYSTYAKLCPRAQQIDSCIQAAMDDMYGCHCAREKIIDALCFGIAHSNLQSYWTAYKRLCKRTPLDKDLLAKVTEQTYNLVVEVDVEKKQRQFQFS